MSTGPVRSFVGTALSAMLLGTVILLAAALIVVPKLAGAKPLTVLTGSMIPTYPPGTVVVVKPVKPERLDIGDTLTYQIHSDDPAVITHRIVAVRFAADGTREFITRGDANGADDPMPVKPGQVRGTVWYSVPYVGHLSNGLSSSSRRLAIDVLAAGLLVYGAVLVVGAALDRRRRRLPSEGR
ncbi:MAG: signal peptidase I [Nocardioidaceae bacterium]